MEEWDGTGFRLLFRTLLRLVMKAYVYICGLVKFVPALQARAGRSLKNHVQDIFASTVYEAY